MSRFWGVLRCLFNSGSSVAAAPVVVNPITTLSTLDYAYQGTPFVEGAIAITDLTTLDYAYKGTPFMRKIFV